MKSRLIRLMTHLDTDLKHCAADLIFVLCKENGESKQGEYYQLSERAIPFSTFPFKFTNNYITQLIYRSFIIKRIVHVR